MIADTARPLRAALLCAATAVWASPGFCAPQAATAPAQARETPARLDATRDGPLIAQLVARLLEQTHYSHHPIDKQTSQQFLKFYLDSYDYNHMIFDKADVDEFTARYADTLGEGIKTGDVQPAYDIFERFLKRLQERIDLVDKLTVSTVTFDTDETLSLDRNDAPWPASAREMKNLWRLRIKNDLLQERLNKTKPAEQVKTVAQRYERLLRSSREYESSDVLQTYLTALAHTFDPHSDYLAEAQKENFDISMRLSLVGIGAVLRAEDGYAKIVSLVPGGPADADKRLKPNDKIEAVAQGEAAFVEAVGLKLDRIVQMIRGEKGTVVRLRVIPADAIDPATRVVITLVRDEIKLKDQEAKAKILEESLPDGRKASVGVIDLPSFYADMKSPVDAKSTTRDVEKILAYLKKKGIDGLILDLRRNGGGSLAEAVSLVDLFIGQGPVVQVKDNRGLIKVLSDTQSGAPYSGPLVVLTSRVAASASEITAAALQDYGRAVVVGEKNTFGKGTVQSIIELNRFFPEAMRSYKPGALKLTIQKFYRISGGSTQDRGVVPDIRLPSVEDYMDITETSLKNHMPYDEIEPAPFRRADWVSSAKLQELSKASSERVASSPEFSYVREDIERYKQRKEDKFVSLNEAKRLAEKKADDERSQRRKKERLARKEKPLDGPELPDPAR